METETLSRHKYLTDDELRAFLLALRDRKRKTAARDRALFVLMATLGPRPVEVTRLELEDARLGVNATLRIRRAKKRAALGVLDDVPLALPIVRILRAWLKVRGEAPGPLFPGQRGGPLKVRAIERLFKVYARRAGLGPGFAAYCLRHTAGRRAYEKSGGDLRLVQSMLGHASTRTTEIYAHVTPERRRALADSVLADL